MASNNRKKIQEISLIAVFIALVFVFTMLVNIKWPFGNGGLVHLGNVPLFVCSIMLGKRAGAIAGAIGMSLFDIFSGWAMWAPFTFVIVGLMGYVVGLITENRRTMVWYLVSMIAALVIKLIGYFFTEWILYGNPLAALQSVPGNIIQISVAAAVVLIAIKPLESAAKAVGIKYV